MTLKNLQDRYDIAIVGGRVAGAASAILLGRLGYQVLLIERADMPSDTLSTHYTWPDGVAALDRLGVLDEVLATGAPKLPAFQRWNGDKRLIADLVAIDGIDYGLCPRRQIFDPILFEAAARTDGVDVLAGTRATGLLREGESVTGLEIADGDDSREIAACLVVGADGRNSFVARQVDAQQHDVIPGGRFWYYTYYRNATPPDPPAFVTSGTETDFVGTAPTNADLQMVLYGANEEEFADFRGDIEANFEQRVLAHPVMQQTLAEAERVSDVVGFSGIRGYYRDTYGSGWTLVGDAVHQKDPMAGRGMAEALRGAEWLADALAGGIDDEALSNYAVKLRDATSTAYQLVRISVRPDRYRTEEQGQLLKERIVSDQALTEFMRLWYDDSLTFEEYFSTT